MNTARSAAVIAAAVLAVAGLTGCGEENTNTPVEHETQTADSSSEPEPSPTPSMTVNQMRTRIETGYGSDSPEAWVFSFVTSVNIVDVPDDQVAGIDYGVPFGKVQHSLDTT